MSNSLRRPVLLVLLALGVVASCWTSVGAEITRALYDDADDLPELRQRLADDVARDPDDAEDWRDLGVCELRLGNAEEGLRALQRSISLDPEPDEWREAYRVLALERLGRAEEAAAGWEEMATVLDRHEERLRGRAAALRLWSSSTTEAGSGSVSAALLPPTALGEDPHRLSGVLGATLGAALRWAGLEVMPADRTAELLARKGRRAEELEDAEGRGRVGRALDGSGIEALVTSSYFLMEDATLLVSVAVLPVTAEGVDPTRPYQATAPMARALRVVPELAVAIARDLGAEGVDETALRARLPETLEGARSLLEGESALDRGDLASALAALSAASAADPSATSLAARVEAFTALDGLGDDPVVVDLADPAALIELLVDAAQRERRRTRKFTDN